MYSDKPRYYQPPPQTSQPHPRFNPNAHFQTRHTSSNHSDMPRSAAFGSGGGGGGGGGRSGRYGNLGVNPQELYSPTPHRAPSSRMRAWADEDVLSGNTAQTGFSPQSQPSAYVSQQPPTSAKVQYRLHQDHSNQQQQWGHVPRHSLAGALSPGPGLTGSGHGQSQVGQHPFGNPTPSPSGFDDHIPRQASMGAASSSAPSPDAPSSVPPPLRSSSHNRAPSRQWYIQATQDITPMHDARRSSLTHSALSANPETRRASGAGSGKGKNKRNKNKRKQDDEADGYSNAASQAATEAGQQAKPKERGDKRKGQGPPPMAKLGGPGGATYAERQREKNRESGPNTDSRHSGAISDVARIDASSNGTAPANQAEVTDGAYSRAMYKDKPIEVRLPLGHAITVNSQPVMGQDVDSDGWPVDTSTQDATSTDVTAPAGTVGAADIQLPESPEETPTPLTEEVDGEVQWKGKIVKVSLPSVPNPSQGHVGASSEPWLPGPISQAQIDSFTSTAEVGADDVAGSASQSTSLEPPFAVNTQRRDMSGSHASALSPVFASPAQGNEDLGASPSTIGRTRENSSSEYQATISRAAFLRPSAPAFLPASQSRVFQRSATTPLERGDIDEIARASPPQQQNRVVSDTHLIEGGEGPRKKLQPSAPSFTPSHASSRSRTSTSSVVSSSHLSAAAHTFSPKKLFAALPAEGVPILTHLFPPNDVTSTPGPSSRPSMTKVATSPVSAAAAAKGTLRASAPMFLPADQGTFTFKPPMAAKGRPSLLSAFGPPASTSTSLSTSDGKQDTDVTPRVKQQAIFQNEKGGYLGGLGSGMSLPIKKATMIQYSPTDPENTIDNGGDPSAAANQAEAGQSVEDAVKENEAAGAEDRSSPSVPVTVPPEISPALPSDADNKFGSMSASELFFKPPLPTPGMEREDIFSALGITPLTSKAPSVDASTSQGSAFGAEGGEEGGERPESKAAQHKQEESYDSEAGMRSGYVEDLGDDDYDYGEEMGHGASSGLELEPEPEPGRGGSGHDVVPQAGDSLVRAHLPTESFGIPSPVDRRDISTVPSLQHVPRYVPHDQPSSPTTPNIIESPLQHHSHTSDNRLSRHFAPVAVSVPSPIPETPQKTVEVEQEMQISASPTPARRSSAVPQLDSPEQHDQAVYDRDRRQSDLPVRPRPLEPVDSSRQAVGRREDPAADDAKFRNWVFPTPDKMERPGISRRYTMPLRDIATAPAYSVEGDVGTATGEGADAGVASTTLAERVSELRDVLGARQDAYANGERLGEDVFGSVRLDRNTKPPQGDMHRQASDEFPLRQKTLKVVNATPKRQSLAEERTNDKLRHMPSPSEAQEAVTDLLLEVREALDGLASAHTAKKEDAEEGLQLRQLLATIEGMRGDLLDMSSKRGLDSQEDLQRRRDMVDLSQQLFEQNARFDALLGRIKQQPEEEDTSRTNEMFTALLSGQHAMLDKFSALTEEREIEGDQLIAAVDALQAARQAAEKDRELVKQKDDLIHSLRQQLAEVKVASRTVINERDELRSAATLKGAEEKATKQEVASLTRKLAASERDRQAAERELDTAKAIWEAAEQERDVIAEALSSAHGYREDMEREMVDLRHQLELERTKSAAPAVVPHIDMSAQVAELFSANKTFQDDLFAQIAFLQKDIVEAREAQGEAVEEMGKDKSTLRERVTSLEAELDEAKMRATRSEIQAITEAEHNLATQTVLDSKLSTALAARDAAQVKVKELEKALSVLRQEKDDLQVIATERTSAMRHSEARLQTLAQENVYWRQFALSYDRREYRKFLGSKPFRDADGNPVDTSPANLKREAGVSGSGGKTGKIDHDATNGSSGEGSGSAPAASAAAPRPPADLVDACSPILKTPHGPVDSRAHDEAYLTPTATPLGRNKGKGKAAAPPSTGASNLQGTPDLSMSTSTSTPPSTAAPSRQ